MEDPKIIELFWQRDEQAIAATEARYGRLCHRLAENILNNHEDAQECVADMLVQAWHSIPPEKPVHFRAWLCRIVRNLALNRWNKIHAQKRGSGVMALFDELEDCIPSPNGIEEVMEEMELSAVISQWLRSLDREDRVLFLRRYWFGEALQDLAKERQTDPGLLAGRMFRLRRSLRKHLEKEGVLL